MNTRTVTRTFVFVALMLALGVAGAYAQHPHGHVKMTFSGTNVATTINLQANTVTDEMHAAGKGSLGRFTFRELHADGIAPSLPPAARGLLSETERRRRLSFSGRQLVDRYSQRRVGLCQSRRKVCRPSSSTIRSMVERAVSRSIRGTYDDGHPDARAAQRHQRARAPADCGSVRGNDLQTGARKRRPLGDSSPLATGWSR